MADKGKERERAHYVLNAEPGAVRIAMNPVTLDLVTSVSTSANASFDKMTVEFQKRISDKAATIFVPVPAEEKKAP